MARLDIDGAGASRQPVAIRLLDGFGITYDGTSACVPSSVQRLVAFVALSDVPLCRDLVAGALWLEKTEERAHANLRQALWRLGQIDEHIVDRHGDQLLIGDEVAVDVRIALAQSRRLVDLSVEVDEGDLDSTPLSRDLLPGWYDDWVVVARERFSQLRLYALEHLCLRLVAKGRFAQAVDVGIASVAEDPLRESAQRALIAAHFADGNWHEGLRQFERYDDVLYTTLGLRPSQAMLDLVDRVRSPEANGVSNPEDALHAHAR